MKKYFGVLILLVAGAGASCATPPKVVRTVPKYGEQNVDPELNRILVEFDQDMSAGYSWTTWGKNFPKTAGKPKWTNTRTCVLPVKLQPGRRYVLGINSTVNTQFRNKKGEAALPYLIAFSTKSTKSVSKANKEGQDENKRAFDQLRKAIDLRYSYRDLRNVDWEKRFAKFRKKITRAETPDAFAFHATMLLSAGKDSHLWVKTPTGLIPTFRRSVVSNFSGRILSKVVPKIKKHNSVVVSGEFPDGIGYILIASFGNQNKEQLRILPSLLKRFAKAKGIIIDARANGGGNEILARQFAGRFIDKAVVYAKHRYRSPGKKDKYLGPFSRKLLPIKTGPIYRGKTAVLVGQRVVSSAEAFVLMMKQVPNCKLIGDRTQGSSGNPQPVTLANGVIVYLPSWQAMTAEGEMFEGKGIAPDIRVKARPQDFQNGDPMIEAALRWLRGTKK